VHILLPFHKEALHIAEQWMSWAHELQCGRNHTMILMPTKGIDFAKVEALARETFASVDILLDCEKITGHPAGPNSMMRQAAWHCQMEKIGPWMFCEPDNIPLVTDAFDRWEREYKAFGKDFMGCFRPAHDVTPDYLSGNMMIPLNVLAKASRLGRRVLSKDNVELAFDIVAAEQILPNAHFTKLLQQVPKNADGTSITFPDRKSLSIISPDAVFFHPCKDGSLIERLREAKSSGYSAAPTVVSSGGGTTTVTVVAQTVPFEEYLGVIRERDLLLIEVAELKATLAAKPAAPVVNERLKHALKPVTPERKKSESRSAKMKESWAKRKAAKLSNPDSY
jgi:hypothetical protein